MENENENEKNIIAQLEREHIVQEAIDDHIEAEDEFNKVVNKLLLPFVIISALLTLSILILSYISTQLFIHGKIDLEQFGNNYKLIIGSIFIPILLPIIPVSIIIYRIKTGYYDEINL